MDLEVWENETFSREFDIAYAVLHEIVERLHPSQYNQQINRYFKESGERLKTSGNPKELIASILRETLKQGIDFKFSELYEPLSLEDVEHILDIKGYFGMVENQKPEGFRIIYLITKVNLC